MTHERADRFNGKRLTALRHIFGITQTTLAEQLGATQSFLSQVERGTRPAPDSLILETSSRYNMPLAFFTVQASPMESGPVTFRKTTRVTAKDEERISELYNEAARLFRSVSAASGYVTTDLPDPGDFGNDPEEVAVELRRAAGLDDEMPVLNATRTIERLGVGVIDRLDERGLETGHTGISRPSRLNDRPLVALMDEVPGAVKRLTLLHELYHLIADVDLAVPIKSTRSEEEKRAFRFAGAFLLPERVVHERVSESLNLHGYLPIKADYGISVGAISRRAFDLGVISAERYRSVSIQLSSAGWRTNEPVDVADEKPLLLNQALRKAFGGQAIARASHVVGSSPDWIRRWTHNQGDDAIEPAANVIHLAARRGTRSE